MYAFLGLFSKTFCKLKTKTRITLSIAPTKSIHILKIYKTMLIIFCDIRCTKSKKNVGMKKLWLRLCCLLLLTLLTGLVRHQRSTVPWSFPASPISNATLCSWEDVFLCTKASAWVNCSKRARLSCKTCAAKRMGSPCCEAHYHLQKLAGFWQRCSQVRNKFRQMLSGNVWEMHA